MAGCIHKDDCPLFEKFTVSASLRIWRLLYCDKDDKFATCARFKATLRAETVPINLLPNGQLLKNVRPEDDDAS